MKRAAEKIGQLLNYEKLSNIRLLELPKIEKKDIPSFIHCPKYEKAKTKIEQSMERYRSKVDRCDEAIRESKRSIEAMKQKRSSLDPGSGFWVNKEDGQAVASYNDRLDQVRKMTDKIENAIEKHNDLIDKHTEAEEEAKEKLEELTLESLQVIDEDIAMVINRCESIADNLAGSEDAEDLIAAIDICLIELRIYAMFEDLIEDNSVRKDCRECTAKVNQMFATLYANENVQSYLVDLYRRNLDLVQTNAGICQQIAGVLGSVDKGQLDILAQSIIVVLTEEFETNFMYHGVIDPAEIDVIVAKIKNTIDVLNQNIVKAKEIEIAAVDFAKAGVDSNQQAETLLASMYSNVEALDGTLTRNHIAVQMIEEAVIDDFYQKDPRVAATTLRKHLINAIGEENFEDILKGGDDRFSLKEARDIIDKANLVRLQAALDKIPSHVKKLTELITSAESDIQRANEVPKQNAVALSSKLSKKYIFSCVPVIGFISAFGIYKQVKTFEPAFRGTNQIFKDLGGVLLRKNKKLTIVVMILGAVFSFGGLIAFFDLSLAPVGVVLVTYIITVLVLFLTGKKLQSFLGISGRK